MGPVSRLAKIIHTSYQFGGYYNARWLWRTDGPVRGGQSRTATSRWAIGRILIKGIAEASLHREITTYSSSTGETKFRASFT